MLTDTIKIDQKSLGQYIYEHTCIRSWPALSLSAKLIYRKKITQEKDVPLAHDFPQRRMQLSQLYILYVKAVLYSFVA